MNISREKTVKLCEESQMTLIQWYELWKKDYVEKVVYELENVAELDGRATYDNPLYEPKSIVELDKAIEILETIE